MALDDTLANIISEGSRRRSAMLSEGFSNVAKMVSDAPLRKVQIEAEKKKIDYYTAQNDITNRALAKDKEVQSVYEGVAKQFDPESQDFTLEVRKQLMSKGHYKEAEDASTAWATKETNSAAATFNKIKMAGAANDMAGETAAAALSLPADQQRDVLDKLVTQYKEQYGIDFNKQLPEAADTKTKLNMLVKLSKEGRTQKETMYQTLLQFTDDRVAQLDIGIKMATDAGDRKLVETLTRTRGVLYGQQEQVALEHATTMAVNRGKLNESKSEAIKTALLNSELMSVSGRTKVAREKIPGVVNLVSELMDATGMDSSEAVETAKNEYVIEGGWFTKAKLKEFNGVPVQKSDGTTMFITKDKVEQALTLPQFGGFKPENLYLATPEQRKAAFNALKSYASTPKKK